MDRYFYTVADKNKKDKPIAVFSSLKKLNEYLIRNHCKPLSYHKIYDECVDVCGKFTVFREPRIYATLENYWYYLKM